MAPETPPTDSAPASGLWRTVAPLLVVAFLLTAAAGPASAQSAGQEEAVIFDIQPDGTVEVTVVLTFDLTTEHERQAFRTIETNQSTREDIRTRFQDRMARLAEATTRKVDRDVVVTETQLSVETAGDGDMGIVRLRATIRNLADVQGERILLTEPLASGFDAERPVIVRLPDGYTVDHVTPAPDGRRDGTLRWDASTTFDGFELALAPGQADDSGDQGTTGTTDSDRTGATTPGFGIGTAALVLVGIALLVFHRSRSK
ncbi:MAG: DUF4897 domain-containing protein [Halanaeroarchaeum sp.]